MSQPEPKMRSIWYLVGAMLLVMGALVAAAGVAELIAPSGRATVLAELRPSLWWGGVMLVAGGVFFASERWRAR